MSAQGQSPPSAVDKVVVPLRAVGKVVASSPAADMAAAPPPTPMEVVVHPDNTS